MIRKTLGLGERKSRRGKNERQKEVLGKEEDGEEGREGRSEGRKERDSLLSPF